MPDAVGRADGIGTEKSHCLVDDREVIVAPGLCACTRRGNLNDKGHEEIEGRQGIMQTRSPLSSGL